MESDITDFFLLIEYFLKDEIKCLMEDDNLKIDNMRFNKVVLPPLMIDFSYKNMYQVKTGK